MEASSPAATDRHVVVVVFGVKPDNAMSFRGAVLDNARTSLMTEPGCLVFDVCEASDRPTFFLYELYKDRAAFDLHLGTDHFKAFDAMSASWVLSKTVSRFERLCAIGPAPTSRGE